MSESVAYLLVEAIVVFSVVLGVHALRRRTTLVYSYAVLAFMRLGSWIATHNSMVEVGWLRLNVGSNVFFSAALLGVFLLYVADGRFAGRAALVVVVASGILYTTMAVLMHAQFPGIPLAMFPTSGLRASLASIAASLLDLVLLGMIWEGLQRQRLMAVPLWLRVFLTLAVVFIADGVVYVPLSRAGTAGFVSELGGIAISRGLVAAILAPIVAAYLSFETRRYGLRLEPRAMLSIVLHEDTERELVSARHQLRIGTEALWESEERYRRMVEDIPLMVFRFSSDGRLTYANHAICAYYDRDVKEMLGLPVLTPIDLAERERLWDAVLALSPEHPTTELTAHATPSRGPLQGQRRAQRWVVRGIFSPSGERLAYQAVGKDITREVELEARAVESERMEAIGQLASGIAHDFNNLIFVIWSCVEAASESLRSQTPDRTRAVDVDLLDIRHAADRASSLTRQLMAVGRDQPIQAAPVDLSALVNGLRPLLKRLLPGSIGLELRCEAAMPSVLADPAQIERVVINLVTNARDAMPSGGPLILSTRAEASDPEPPGPSAGRSVVLTVTDAGVGMDAATMRRVFEPFFTTKSAGRGTGLGLSTAYGIVEQAGGRIRVESTPGTGTTFFVSLPVHEDLAAAPSRREPAPPAALGPILYCEGEDSLRGDAVELLENAGYRVACVSDAHEAVAFVEAGVVAAPCLLLVDVVTGTLSGAELAAAIRRRHPELPAVFFTGSAEPDAADEKARHWYVNKRHGLRTLVAVVAQATAPHAVARIGAGPAAQS